MKVIFLMLAFPDMDKSFNMYTSLVEEFHLHGHEVVVVAPGKGTTRLTTERGIPVIRVKTLPLKNVPFYIKGISNLLLPFQFGRAVKKYCADRNFDLIVMPTPPITLVDLTAKLKSKYGGRLYLILRDIFPQNAVDLGFMRKGGIVYRYFRSKESKLYNLANYIGCMSPGNIQYIIRHNKYIEIGKVHELKNFQKSYTGNSPNQNYFKDKYNLRDKFVVVFGGNMGKPQQIENVLQLAQSCQNHPDILFLLLGEGVQANQIESQIKNQGLENIIFDSTLEKQDYQDLLKSCDIGLISLHKAFTIPNIPSKALDYFNIGMPVLASLDQATDFGHILDEHDMGLWSYAGDNRKFLDNLLLLYRNKELCKRMGRNGRRYFERNLTPDLAYESIMKALN